MRMQQLERRKKIIRSSIKQQKRKKEYISVPVRFCATIAAENVFLFQKKKMAQKLTWRAGSVIKHSSLVLTFCVYYIFNVFLYGTVLYMFTFYRV